IGSAILSATSSFFRRARREEHGRVKSAINIQNPSVDRQTEILMIKGRFLTGLMAVAGVSMCVSLMGAANLGETEAPNRAKTTFYKDVLPILQNNCQGCHRPGEVAPMSLMTYEDARRWALAMQVGGLTPRMAR